DVHCGPPAAVHSHPVDPCEIGYIRSPHSRWRPVRASLLLPAVTAPGTVFVHLLLAHQARPLYSLTLGASFLFWRPRVRLPCFFFLLKGCAFLYLFIHNFRLYPSSTVQKVKMLELSHLDKAKMALALHFRLSRRDHSSRNVGGSAAPEARIAAEACAWS